MKRGCEITGFVSIFICTCQSSQLFKTSAFQKYALLLYSTLCPWVDLLSNYVLWYL